MVNYITLILTHNFGGVYGMKKEFKEKFDEAYKEYVCEKSLFREYEHILREKNILPKMKLRFHIVDRHEDAFYFKINQFSFSLGLAMVTTFASYYLWFKSFWLSVLVCIASIIFSGCITYGIDAIIWHYIPRMKYVNQKLKEEKEKKKIVEEITNIKEDDQKNIENDDEIYKSIHETVKKSTACSEMYAPLKIQEGFLKLTNLISKKEKDLKQNNISPQQLYRLVSIYMKEIAIIISKADFSDTETVNKIKELINKLYTAIDKNVIVSDSIAVSANISVIDNLLNKEIGNGGMFND